MNECVREIEWWERYPLHQIWCNSYCPIVPRIWSREADSQNAWAGGFHWLLFHTWTMSHFSFGVDVDISFHRVGVGFTLPYLRVFVGFAFLPFYKIGRKLSRDPEWPIEE